MNVVSQQKLPYDGKTVEIPRDLAVCPYCEGTLTVSVNAWEEAGSDTDDTEFAWNVSEIDLSCEHEDAPDAPDHAYMPYVYLLPVEVRILAWLNRTETQARLAF